MALDRPYPKIWRIGPKWAQSEALIQLEIVWTNLKSRDIILYSVNFCCREIGTVEHRGVFACIRPNCWWPSICWNAHTSSRIRATDNSRKIMMRLLAYWWKLVLLLLLIFFRAKVSPSKVLLLKSTASFSITFKTLGFSLSFSLNKPSFWKRKIKLVHIHTKCSPSALPPKLQASLFSLSISLPLFTEPESFFENSYELLGCHPTSFIFLAFFGENSRIIDSWKRNSSWKTHRMLNKMVIAATDAISYGNRGQFMP